MYKSSQGLFRVRGEEAFSRILGTPPGPQHEHMQEFWNTFWGKAHERYVLWILYEWWTSVSQEKLKNKNDRGFKRISVQNMCRRSSNDWGSNDSSQWNNDRVFEYKNSWRIFSFFHVWQRTSTTRSCPMISHEIIGFSSTVKMLRKEMDWSEVIKYFGE